MTDTSLANPKTILVRRPHFDRRGDEIFFLASRHPTLSLTKSEAKIWETLECEKTVSELRRQHGDLPDSSFKRLTENHILEVLPTIPATKRKKVVVFEPHSDDAALSVGGTMLSLMDDCEFTIATLASRSNFTSYYYSTRNYFETEKITQLRHKESLLFARSLNGRHHNFDLNDALLRYFDGNWSQQWLENNRGSVAAFQNHRYNDEEIRLWQNTVFAFLQGTDFDEIWIPAGIGEHVDHGLTRDACLQAVLQIPALTRESTILLYEDVPYAWRRPGHERTILDCIEQCGGVLESRCTTIDNFVEQKLRSLSIYASQFKVKVIENSVLENAKMVAKRLGRSEKFAEQLWLLRNVPAAIDKNMIYYDREIIDRLKMSFGNWFRSATNASKVRLLFLLEPGRWSDDAATLIEYLPNATFDVFATAGSSAEMSRCAMGRFSISYLDKGPGAWLKLAAKLAVSEPCPTVFISGTKRIKEARWVSHLWPMTATIVVPTLDHLLILFEEHVPPTNELA